MITRSGRAAQDFRYHAGISMIGLNIGVAAIIAEGLDAERASYRKSHIDITVMTTAPMTFKASPSRAIS